MKNGIRFGRDKRLKSAEGCGLVDKGQEGPAAGGHDLTEGARAPQLCTPQLHKHTPPQLCTPHLRKHTPPVLQKHLINFKTFFHIQLYITIQNAAYIQHAFAPHHNTVLLKDRIQQSSTKLGYSKVLGSVSCFSMAIYTNRGCYCRSDNREYVPHVNTHM